MIISMTTDTAMETSINQYGTNPLVILTMAGSRTYVGPAYYDFRQPVTEIPG